SWTGHTTDWTDSNNWSTSQAPSTNSSPPSAQELRIVPTGGTIVHEPTISPGAGYACYVQSLFLDTGSTVSQSNGTLNVQLSAQIGWLSPATYGISGGSLIISAGGLATELNIVSNSTFTQTSGTVSVNDSGGILSIAADSFNQGSGPNWSGAGT